MPAQSPTLSPTLSAITAGLRGSSSGMPASTLPTRSAPTSAPLVKMPPPRRAKIEISEAPKDRPTRASRMRALLDAEAEQDAVIDGDAEQAQRHDEHAGDRARLEGDVEAAGEAAGGGRLGGADVGAHRDVHADEAGRGRQAGADRVADADLEAEEEGEQDQDDHADAWRWSCTGGGDRRWHPPGWPRRSPASARCRPASPGCWRARLQPPEHAGGAAGQHQHVEKPLNPDMGTYLCSLGAGDHLRRARIAPCNLCIVAVGSETRAPLAFAAGPVHGRRGASCQSRQRFTVFIFVAVAWQPSHAASRPVRLF